MKIAKVQNGKIVGIVEKGDDDGRIGEDKLRIYRPVVEVTPQIDAETQVLGKKTYSVEDERVVESREVINLDSDQIKGRKLAALLTDLEMPTIFERLDALESGDSAKVKENADKVAALKAKHKVE